VCLRIASPAISRVGNGAGLGHPCKRANFSSRNLQSIVRAQLTSAWSMLMTYRAANENRSCSPLSDAPVAASKIPRSIQQTKRITASDSRDPQHGICKKIDAGAPISGNPIAAIPAISVAVKHSGYFTDDELRNRASH